MKNGSIEILLIFFIIIFGVLITGVFNNFTDKPNPGNATYQLISPTNQPAGNQIQLHSLNFKVITPTPPQNSSGNCSNNLLNSTNLQSIITQIHTHFGVIVTGDASLTIDKAYLVYNTLCLLFYSKQYIENLNSIKTPTNPNPAPIYVTFSNRNTCFAETLDGSHTSLFEPCTDRVDAYILVHEFTHIMQKGTALGRNSHWAQWQQIWSSQKSHKIPTGPCVIEDPGDGGECEADAVGEFVFYKEYRNYWLGSAGNHIPPAPDPADDTQFPSYPLNWPQWYTFVQSQFFDFLPGHDFYNP